MNRDLFAVAGIVLSFAMLVTSHVCIAFGLARRPPRTRALAALVFPPLAPYWAIREKMRFRAASWLVALAAYGALRWLART